MKKYIFFSFLFLFFLISFISASVVPISPIPNFTISSSSSQSFNLKDYFRGTYDTLNFKYNAVFSTVTKSFEDSSSCYNSPDGIDFCFYPSTNDIQITLSSTKGGNVFVPITLSVYNQSEPYNASCYLDFSCYSNPQCTCYQATYYTQTFYVNLSYDTTSYNTAQDDGFIGALTNAFIQIYPSADTLSIPVKFGYVFVTIFLFFLLYYGILFFILHGKTKNLSSFFHYIFFIIVIIQVFFFISISYVPLGVLIFVMLALIVLAFFRIKSGFSAGGK